MNTANLFSESAQGNPRVALIAGPTASGKSDIALSLAKSHPVTIINADASQVYRDIPILSAAPTAAEQAQSPHALFGHKDGSTAYNAAEWAADARSAIHASLDADRTPVLVGGTGLYLNSLLNGIAPIPEIDPDIRSHVRGMDTPAAYAALSSEDDVMAARINPGDTTRISRALEVIRSTGISIAEWQARTTGGILPHIALCPLILLPPRDWLYARCDARFSAMVDRGAMEEVRVLMARHLDPDLPVMRAIGVPDLVRHMRGEMQLDAAIAAGAMATRRYAKRQYTWFRNQPPANWHREQSEINDSNIDRIVILLRNMILT